MARIPYVEKDGAPQEVAETFAKMEARGNPVVNLWKMVAHSPATLIHVIRTGNSLLTKTRIDPRLREMAILRTAEMLDCAYEIRAHARAGLREGMTDEQVKSIKNWESSNNFNDIERAVLRFTDEVARVARVKDETFSNLAQYLDEGMMAELALIVGFYGMLARILLPFEVDLD
ncbi:MAG: carboxymuconolactone decarboxylase family protein [Chloroflexi bacterium]|nr:carboxymuconolactone decarboxylase family protein [Chloroflexota bacterium]MBI3041018.1 carboxymuconolactone decarboxylase family protein [Chloroflexota bacterium]MBI3931361.1 carboxymuconolactone decarboxylase family protein [Chloroflexota bacterium]